jgi:4-hydroxy-tetrahydrodipicolinate synthase
MTTNSLWTGVMPAITTPFNADLSVDHASLAEHCRWMLDSGCTAIVAPGSLGEGATLSADEKAAVLKSCVVAAGGAPVIAAVSALATADAVALARRAAELGCRGLMVLPPYVYVGDEAEMEAHLSAVIAATPLPCMLYNNPVAYRTDFRPERIAALAERHDNLAAVKESSTDVRRITAIRALIGERLVISVGVDDLIVEGIAAGATGWVAGLVNAFPMESVALFNAATRGDEKTAAALYRWFLPLLRMDTVPKFVQLIKLVQQETGRGSARVRPPRMELAGAELSEAKAVIAEALRTRPG